MKIDILMATYNGSKYIESQIFSILSQTYKNWNLIIHDDGSDDSTVEIVKKISNIDKRIKIIENDVKCGGAGLNFMHILQFSDADYIMYCDQDDIWFDNKIELQLKVIMSKNNEIPQIVYSNSYVWIPSDGIKGLSTLTFPKKINQFLFLNSGMQGCSAIFNKKMLNLLMSYKGKISMHDHILHLSGLCFGEIEYMPNTLMLYRNHDKNVTGATSTSSTDIKQIIQNINFPVVDRNHYDAVACFYEVFKFELKKNDIDSIESHLKMLKYNFFKRLYYVLKSDFQLFNSNLRLMLKIIFRPYIN